ncbi:hypothetical protein E2C01_066462 [Portunus trituberculatus]|uniref:Uncharacterized protein n=1 Tax=Portunus trituberculatus TaxID=210409 RepID=A0A5B7HTX1_PORTR|nr:hypothetical protein [Portunus trituberculatus]
MKKVEFYNMFLVRFVKKSLNVLHSIDANYGTNCDAARCGHTSLSPANYHHRPQKPLEAASGVITLLPATAWPRHCLAGESIQVKITAATQGPICAVLQ